MKKKEIEKWVKEQPSRLKDKRNKSLMILRSDVLSSVHDEINKIEKKNVDRNKNVNNLIWTESFQLYSCGHVKENKDNFHVQNVVSKKKSDTTNWHKYSYAQKVIFVLNYSCNPTYFHPFTFTVQKAIKHSFSGNIFTLKIFV